MARVNVKPWSEFDEAPAQSERTVVQQTPRHAPPPSVVMRPDLSPSPTWSLAPLALLVLACLVMLIFPPLRSEFVRLTAVLFALLGGFAGALIIHAVRTRQQLVAEFERTAATGIDGLRRLDEVLVPEDLRSVFRSFRQALAESDVRLEPLEARLQQVELQQRLDEIHRHQAEGVVDGVPEALLVVDEFDQVQYLNPSAEALFSVSKSAVLRKPLAELSRDEALIKLIHQCREAGVGTARRSIEHVLGDRAYAVIASAMERRGEDDRTGEPSGDVVLMLRDITREREISKAKSDFVAKVAHELRTPLSSIKAYVEMLVDNETDDEKTRREYYEVIQTSSNRLGRLIDNMLNISRIEAGTVRVNKEPIAIAVVLKEALDVARPQADARHLTLEEEQTPVFHQVQADRDLIYQAILNLLSNAIKYTAEGGTVTVRSLINEEQRTIAINVTDTGAGIPEADLPRMFEKFFRVEANKSMAKGTGLGLNLVKHIVETVHGGRVGLKSKVGQGSTFSITLPLVG